MAGVLAAFTGPLAIEISALERLLLLGFLPIYLAAGAVLSSLLSRPSAADAALPAELLSRSG